MIKEFVDKWDKNKNKLRDWIALNHPKSYEKLVGKLFELVLNDNSNDYDDFSIADMVVIDHGDYQGMQIFILHRNTYQPGIGDYVFTHNYYGSCSGCDTLQSISEYSEELPTKSQIEDYMTLALYLVQKLKWFVDPSSQNDR